MRFLENNLVRVEPVLVGGFKNNFLNSVLLDLVRLLDKWLKYLLFDFVV